MTNVVLMYLMLCRNHNRKQSCNWRACQTSNTPSGHVRGRCHGFQAYWTMWSFLAPISCSHGPRQLYPAVAVVVVTSVSAAILGLQSKQCSPTCDPRSMDRIIQSFTFLPQAAEYLTLLGTVFSYQTRARHPSRRSAHKEGNIDHSPSPDPQGMTETAFR